jgi:hypothetical protein
VYQECARRPKRRVYGRKYLTFFFMFAVGLPLESADSVAKEAKYEDCNEARS